MLQEVIGSGALNKEALCVPWWFIMIADDLIVLPLGRIVSVQVKRQWLASSELSLPRVSGSLTQHPITDF